MKLSSVGVNQKCSFLGKNARCIQVLEVTEFVANEIRVDSV